MAIFDVVKHEGVNNELVWKWPSDKMAWGSKVIVNQTQEAMFYKNGQALDLLGPGSHDLNSENIPLLQSIINIPYGNDTPFPVEIYFIDKAVVMDVKWGTPRPVPILDPILNIFLPIRANGQFGFRVKDSRKLVVQLVGTVASLSTEDINNYFRGVILTKSKDYIASQLMERRLSILTVTAHLDEMSKALKEKLQDDFALYGLEVVNFFINAIDVPEDDPEVKQVKQAMASKAEMRILGEEAYRVKRTFDVLEASAKNEGGGNFMGAGMGLGMGVGAGTGFANMATNAISGGAAPGALPQQANKALPAPAPSDMVTCGTCGNKSFSAFKFCTTCGAGLITPNAICPTCGVEVPVGAKFCGHCGLKMGIDVCPYCKHQLPPGAQDCPNCNSKMGNKQ